MNAFTASEIVAFAARIHENAFDARRGGNRQRLHQREGVVGHDDVGGLDQQAAVVAGLGGGAAR